MGLIVFIALILANKFKVKFTSVYVILGILLWILILKSGIHATIAGVLLGMALPIGKTVNEFETSILYRIDETLSSWSSFVVMPIFALANSGITIDFRSISTLINNPVSLGIIFGLCYW